MADNLKKYRKALKIVLCVCLALSCCGSRADVIEHKSKEELEIGYYCYEGIFLSTEEVTEAFQSASDDFPRYPVVPEVFHITTEYMPDTTHENLYGTEVTVHITGYLYGTSTDAADGSTSLNEGFRVEVKSENPVMQELLDHIDANWHITGSYTTAARYTKYMDFSDASPLDFVLTGTFGWCDSDNRLVLDRRESNGS